MSWTDNSVTNWWNLPICNSKPDLHNIKANIKFGENTLRFSQITGIVLKGKYDVLQADYSVKSWRILPNINPKPDLHNINAHNKYCENPFIFTQVIIRKWADNSVRNWWNLAIFNSKPDLHSINANIKFGENTLRFTKIIVLKGKYDVLQADNSVKNWQVLPISNPKPDLHNINAHKKFRDNPLIFTHIIIGKWKYWFIMGRIYDICPLAIPNRTSSISIHKQHLVKIH